MVLIKFGSAQALGQGVVSALGSDLSLYLSSPEIFCPKASTLPQSPCCLAFASVASLLLLEIWNFCWFFKEEKLTKRNKEFFIAHPSLYSSWPSVGSLAAPLVGFPPLPPTPKMDSEHFFFMEYVFDNLSSSPAHTLDRHSYMVEVWEMFQWQLTIFYLPPLSQRIPYDRQLTWVLLSR